LQGIPTISSLHTALGSGGIVGPEDQDALPRGTAVGQPTEVVHWSSAAACLVGRDRIIDQGLLGRIGRNEAACVKV